MTQLEYLGPKKIKTVKFPVPYVQHSAEEGSVTFQEREPGGPKVADVPAPWDAKLLALHPDQFRKVPGSSPVKEAAVGKLATPKPAQKKKAATKKN